MLELVNVTKSFENKNVLLNINAIFECGNINILLGKNGIGKSTLLDCIVRPYYLDEGLVLLDGKNVNNIEIRRKIFYLPSYSFIDEDIKAIDYLNFVSNVYTDKNLSFEIFKKDLQILNLENNMNDRINTFSLGMKKKLYFIGSIVSCADYLIYDELFNGIDEESSHYMLEKLDLLKAKRKCIIISTHNKTKLINISDMQYILKEKTLLQQKLINR
ncbi:ATP-binding cassette domain-containing protein [Anaerococcus marasmi]|uniref:ATP-binding cassette domain-containing protein n=1 Tax=Anaerococcus marasmi TaxID=2057797 RepID=UPI000CF90CB0|nr:ATP-binding cassette domain-containing protein [Anaerococcus marasmi]